MEKNNTSRTLNELLVNLFNNVMDREAKAVITEEFKDITNNDMHIIEAIGIEEPQKMSAIAKRLSVINPKFCFSFISDNIVWYNMSIHTFVIKIHTDCICPSDLFFCAF